LDSWPMSITSIPTEGRQRWDRRARIAAMERQLTPVASGGLPSRN